MRASFNSVSGAAVVVAIITMLRPCPANADDWRSGQVFKDCDECPVMVVIPAGSFEMSLPANGNVANENARPAHRVNIKKAFALGQTEVTKRQWRALMGVNPAGSTNCDDCPVGHLSWNAARDFVRRLSEKSEKPYRLPSEAEWEYACRAGGQHEYCGGDIADSLAWHENNSSGGAHAVAGKQPNTFGVYDMSGNVWEWTADCWNVGYDAAPNDGSPWASGACSSRVLRGGSWQYKSQFAGAIIRAGSAIDSAGESDGLRVARSLP